jgi:hypothetical protein
MRSGISSALLATLFCGLFAISAEAQNTRSFVSSEGSDSNSCTLSAPCRSLAQALSTTVSGGEIIILDSAGYGCGLSITKSVTIIAPPGISGRMTCSGGTAITVNSSGIDVVLEGLGIDGASTGILFQAGRTLSLRSVETFGGTGVQHNASGGVLTLADSVLRNGNNCFIAQVETPATPAFATIVNSRAEGCYMGFLAHANSVVTISHSVAVGASQSFDTCYADFIALGDHTGPGTLNLDAVVATSCNYGIAAAPLVSGGTGTITVANSVLTNNNTGTAAFGTISTFGDNRVYGNVMENNGSLTKVSPE